MVVDPQVNRYLAPEQVEDLKDLVKRPGWTALLKLFVCLEAEVAREFESFKTHDEALERRGKLAGIRLGVETVTNLYGGVIEYDRTKPRNTDTGQARITTEPNPGDDPASGPSY